MSKAPVAAPSTLESTLRAGLLLSAIGGFLDGYTYIGHGMVFANAHSGNVLFAALAANMNDYLTTVSISFATALQWSAFANIEGWTYTSIAATGNMRQLADALFTLTIGATPTATATPRARAFATICTGFAIGAVIGALATRAMGNAAALLPAVCLLGMLMMIDVTARFPS
jgi:uncharacterized membrane protein YoaK (UPF0700 family)